jgi:hypothetical protein
MSENGHRMSDNGHNPGPGFGASEDRMRASELDTEMAAFEAQLRDAYVRPPAAAVAEAHVAAMLAEADAIAATAVLEAPTTPARQPHSRWVAARRLALVPVAVLVAGGGLAVAGVRPPEPISDAFESVGIDVPGSDEEESKAGGEKPERAGSGSNDDGEAPANSSPGAGNSANDGPTPGSEQANPNANEGQKTAEQARSGQTPPDGPGRSDDHPVPQGSGTPPEDPGHPGDGRPDSPPGQSQSSAQEHGGGTANQPDKPLKPDPDETEQ